MKDSFYLIFNKTGVSGVRKSRPSLRSGQVCVKVQASIADNFFEQTFPEVTLDIPDDYIQKPAVDMELKESLMDRLTEDESEK